MMHVFLSKTGFWNTWRTRRCAISQVGMDGYTNHVFKGAVVGAGAEVFAAEKMVVLAGAGRSFGS